MKWYFTMILIYIFLITDEVEHIFMSLSATFVFFSTKCPVIVFNFLLILKNETFLL